MGVLRIISVLMAQLVLAETSDYGVEADKVRECVTSKRYLHLLVDEKWRAAGIHFLDDLSYSE